MASVIGFDDVMYAAQMSPLTTIRRPLAEIGRVATTLRLPMIAGEAREMQHIELSTSLVVREWCAAPVRSLRE